MDKLVWSIVAVGNSTEVSENVHSDAATTIALQTTSKSPAGQSVSPEILATVGLIICSIGCCANAVVLAVMIRARRHFGSAVHILIANQSAMDIFASVSAILINIVFLTHGFNYKGNPILDGAICVLFEGTSLAGTGVMAEIIGLMIITLDRYFKIVHAIAHRKYYRAWMTKLGVALPWIGGTCLILFPAMGTTRIVNGDA